MCVSIYSIISLIRCRCQHKCLPRHPPATSHQPPVATQSKKQHPLRTKELLFAAAINTMDSTEACGSGCYHLNVSDGKFNIERNNDNEEDGVAFNYQAIPPTRVNNARVDAPSTPSSNKTSEGPLNYSSNILLVYRLDEMRRMERINCSYVNNICVQAKDFYAIMLTCYSSFPLLTIFQNLCCTYPDLLHSLAIVCLVYW